MDNFLDVDFENCKNKAHLTSHCTGWGGYAFTGGIVGEVFKLYPCSYQFCENEGVLSTRLYGPPGATSGPLAPTRRTGEMHANEKSGEPTDPKQ